MALRSVIPQRLEWDCAPKKCYHERPKKAFPVASLTFYRTALTLLPNRLNPFDFAAPTARLNDSESRVRKGAAFGADGRVEVTV